MTRKLCSQVGERRRRATGLNDKTVLRDTEQPAFRYPRAANSPYCDQPGSPKDDPADRRCKRLQQASACQAMEKAQLTIEVHRSEGPVHGWSPARSTAG